MTHLILVPCTLPRRSERGKRNGCDKVRRRHINSLERVLIFIARVIHVRHPVAVDLLDEEGELRVHREVSDWQRTIAVVQSFQAHIPVDEGMRERVCENEEREREREGECGRGRKHHQIR